MTKRLFWAAILLIALTQISPLITETPKFFCENIGGGIIQCGSLQFKESTFFFARLIIIIAVVLLYGLIQYYQTYRPLKKYNQARKDVFDIHLAPSLENYITQGFSLRINVMRARRPFRCFGLANKLEPVYHYGFEPKHRDTHISLWVIKTFNWAQGNCGEAFLTEKPQLADLTEGVSYKYKLSKKKVKKTDYIKGIISIPVFEVLKSRSTPKAIGVINIDTNDESLVNEWVNDEDCLLSIIDAFENHAKIVSYFI
jgi:hypothetical protein